MCTCFQRLKCNLKLDRKQLIAGTCRVWSVCSLIYSVIWWEKPSNIHQPGWFQPQLSFCSFSLSFSGGFYTSAVSAAVVQAGCKISAPPQVRACVCFLCSLSPADRVHGFSILLVYKKKVKSWRAHRRRPLQPSLRHALSCMRVKWEPVSRAGCLLRWNAFDWYLFHRDFPPLVRRAGRDITLGAVSNYHPQLFNMRCARWKYTRRRRRRRRVCVFVCVQELCRGRKPVNTFVFRSDENRVCDVYGSSRSNLNTCPWGGFMSQNKGW